MTYQELQDRVARRLIDAPANVTTEIPDFVNEGVREVQDRRNFPEMKALLEATTTLQTRILVPTPSDFKAWRLRPFYVENTYGKAIPIDYAPDKEQADIAIQDDEEDRPCLITRSLIDEDDGTSDVLVYPLPDGQSDYSDGEYRVKMPYWKYLPDLVADGDENVITLENQYALFALAWATKLGFELDWNEGRAAYWEKKAEMIWFRIRKRHGMNALSGLATLVPHQGAVVPVIAFQ